MGTTWLQNNYTQTTTILHIMGSKKNLYMLHWTSKKSLSMLLNVYHGHKKELNIRLFNEIQCRYLYAVHQNRQKIGTAGLTTKNPLYPSNEFNRPHLSSCAIKKVTATIAPTASYSPAHKETVIQHLKLVSKNQATIFQYCQQYHQKYQLLQNIITQGNKDNPTATNFIQHQTYHKHIQNLRVTLPSQKIEETKSFQHFANLAFHPNTGESITSYGKLSNDQ